MFLVNKTNTVYLKDSIFVLVFTPQDNLKDERYVLVFRILFLENKTNSLPKVKDSTIVLVFRTFT